MEYAFVYKSVKRILGFIFCSLFIFMAYIFFRGFLQLNEALSSAIWLLFCIIAVAISIYIWNETQVKIIINDNSVYLKRFLNSVTFNLDCVIEYGRDNYRTRTSDSWRYYVILRGDQSKKVTLFHDGLKDTKVISAVIIAKANKAKLVNVGLGMI